MHGAAFFDMDGTLLTVNAAVQWIRHERRRGHVSHRQLLQAGAYLAAYKLGVLPIDRAMQTAAATLVGQPESLLAERTRQWWEAEIARHAAPGAASVLKHERAAGRPLVLLTSSSPWAAACAVRQFGLDDLLCTRFVTRDGLFTGEVERPVCYGPGKVALAEEWARRHNISLDDSSFYTDSHTDLPMLLRVGTPRPVNPDLRLKRAAQRRGWPVLDWRHKPSTQA